MSDDAHPAWAVYDLDRLRGNLIEIRRRIGPDQACIVALKGNAYGHGAVPVAKALDGEGLAAFMTGSFDEACRLRSEQLRTPVVMFAGALPAGMADLVRAGLVPTVVDRASAEAAAGAAPSGEAVPVYVKVNAGLGRLGVPLEAAEAFLGELAAMQGLEVQGLYTHLPFGDAHGRDWAEQKARRLRCAPRAPCRARPDTAGHPGARKRLRCGRVIGSSQRGLRRPPALWPLAICRCLAREPLRVSAGSGRGREPTDTRLRSLRRGSDIAIGGSYRLRHGRCTGVAPIGVAQGLVRPVPGSRPQVLIRGRRAPVLAVSLEHLVLDLTDVEGAAVGDVIWLLGGDSDGAIGLNELAAWFGMTKLDTVMALSGRLTAQYRDAAGAA